MMAAAEDARRRPPRPPRCRGRRNSSRSGVVTSMATYLGVLASVTTVVLPTTGAVGASPVPKGENAATTSSGLLAWVDPATPSDRRTYTSSRGATWTLVMSDEFNNPNRSFGPGEDHLWTALELPDGTPGGLAYYSKNLATTVCESTGADPTCYFQIEVRAEPRSLQVWNPYRSPPGMQPMTMHYQSAMVQSWNKFCFQGGAIEMRVQLPGAIGKNSKNPDLQGSSGSAKRVSEAAFYPTWPGIWMMGNLGRALFRESTNRMWPFSYNRCEPSVFDPANQRISACQENPGYGLNPKQGRGAPEIDIIEGAATEISSSLQVAPGMPDKFRIIYGETPDCVYTSTCTALGANHVGVPSATYATRQYKSWYQKLRYGANNLCEPMKVEAQAYKDVLASMNAGIVANACNLMVCPASFDVNGDLGFRSSNKSESVRWGINVNGTCFPHMNPFSGALLCSEGNRDSECVGDNPAPPPLATQGNAGFKYRTDMISANWPAHVGVYTKFVKYQLEWVSGDKGYLRWMLEGQPIFEVPAESLTTPPQDGNQSNPSKMIPEEPMYLIMNVAVSSIAKSKPPNAGRACRDHEGGVHPDRIAYQEHICDQFPLYLKVDYIRVYQDTSEGSRMAVGCSPVTHPTAKWIKGHKSEYEDSSNPWITYRGGAACSKHADCTLSAVDTGRCKAGRCACLSANWGGPRCIIPWDGSTSAGEEVGGEDTSGSSTDGPFRYKTEVIFVSLIIAVAFLTYATRRVTLCGYKLRRSSVDDDDDEEEDEEQAPPSRRNVQMLSFVDLRTPTYSRHRGEIGVVRQTLQPLRKSTKAPPPTTTLSNPTLFSEL